MSSRPEPSNPALRARWCAAGVTGLLAFGLLLNAAAGAAERPIDHAEDRHMDVIAGDPVPAGTIPWQLLRQVKLVEEKQGGKPLSRPDFATPVKQLDKTDVKLYGFVVPLSTGAKQAHFLISPQPSHCPYCLSQGPDSLVEVVARTPIAFTADEPVVVSGRFELVNDASLYYRLTNAESIKN